MLAMDTSSLETTATLATDIFKAVCRSMLKAVIDMGIDRTILTTNILVGADGDCVRTDGDGVAAGAQVVYTLHALAPD